jgi:FKBP-type peptidyl-prolyl cis-trans isomerase FkpA
MDAPALRLPRCSGDSMSIYFARLAISLAVLVLTLACSQQTDAADTGPGGLKIEHITAGTGASPTATSRVKVHYHGTFEDGRVFDSSVQRGQPAVFPLNRVIKCWTEGLQQKKVGGKAKLTCPPAIAYGAAGRPPKIPADTTLYFEVELLEIQ